MAGDRTELVRVWIWRGLATQQYRHILSFAWPYFFRTCVSFILFFAYAQCQAVGMGDVRVLSGIGQLFKAEVPLFGAQGEDVLQSCVKGRLYNVDGSFITATAIRVNQDKLGKSITVTTQTALYEPALSLQILIECGQHIERSWQILLDLPNDNPLRSISPDLAPTASALEASVPRKTRAARRAARAESLALDLAQPAPAAAIPANSLSASPRPKSKLPSAPASGRSVLRMSHETDSKELAELEQITLRLSQGLSESSLAKAHALDGKTSEPSSAVRSAQELSAMQQKIKMLEAEANRLQQRSEQQDLLLKTNPSEPFPWLIGLSLILCAALAAIAWLWWRMQQLQAGAKLGDSAIWQAATAPAPNKPASNKPASNKSASNKSTSNKPASNKQPVNLGKDASNQRQTATPQATPAPPNLSVLDSSPQDDEEFFEKTSEIAPSFDLRPPPLEVAPLEFERQTHLSERDLDMPTVAEITDAMHEAEFWMSLGKPEKAAEVLEAYGQGEHPSSPLTWLYLFDLYRSLGEREKYGALLVQFHRRFNGKIPAWEDALPNEDEHSLLHLPSILEKICLLWGTSQVLAYLEELIVDNREGMRSGFALPTYREILFLLDVARMVQNNAIETLDFV